jgi:hypothetical protein
MKPTFSFEEPKYKTKSLEHGNRLIYNDVNVYLAGLYDQNELCEYLHGSNLNIEIHDRDLRDNQQSKNPCLFGNDVTDEYISNVNMLASHKTNANPFETRASNWNAYGIGKQALLLSKF